jgi:hypothetical protein
MCLVGGFASPPPMDLYLKARYVIIKMANLSNHHTQIFCNDLKCISGGKFVNRVCCHILKANSIINSCLEGHHLAILSEFY